MDHYAMARDQAHTAQQGVGYGSMLQSATTAPPDTLQNLTGRSLNTAQELLNYLREINSRLFPPTPENVSNMAQDGGPPTLLTGLEALNSTLSEASCIASRIAQRL